MIDGAAAIYRSTVTHRRFVPVGHELRYRATYMYLDIDRLDEAARELAFFGRRRGLFVLRDRDHGPAGEGSLAARVWRLVEGVRVEAPVRRLMMLSMPRTFGYVFNPLTTYYGYGDDGVLRLMIYEVSNTFGERRHYVLPVGQGAGFRREQACGKSLYVSPFNDAEGRYDFTLMPPGDKLRLTVSLSKGGSRVLSAYLAGDRRPLNDREIVRAFAGDPLATYRATAAIHWEALKLWRKGLRLTPRPRAGEPPEATAAIGEPQA
ncbi:DUF1365 domain-containing protein [Lutibaculum baratangense]|uniref:DUF1365 domain-containing protein n=1 Tax=Lutibaculum baratangense AMV1 TaxID=631454 RepID=V4RHX5_9HYPH|nr:DUF1365 domain-containing protein [Lutibaculum baratangense]ESR25731.1 hypothetical protein N177_1564 [Lutibaculum baratangense AMV1]